MPYLYINYFTLTKNKIILIKTTSFLLNLNFRIFIKKSTTIFLNNIFYTLSMAPKNFVSENQYLFLTNCVYIHNMKLYLKLSHKNLISKIALKPLKIQ